VDGPGTFEDGSGTRKARAQQPREPAAPMNERLDALLTERPRAPREGSSRSLGK